MRAQTFLLLEVAQDVNLISTFSSSHTKILTFVYINLSKLFKYKGSLELPI